MPVRIEIGADLAGRRFDVIVTAATPLGRAGARRLFAEGRVRVVQGGRRRRVRKGDTAAAGTWLELEVDGDAVDRAEPDASVALSVVYETDALVIVDKPSGVPSAPIRVGERGTIANGLLARFPEMAAVGFSRREPGVCHRLDTETSGLLLAAKSEAAFGELTGAIRTGAFDKRYLLICARPPLEETGVIDAAVNTQGHRVRVREGGRAAVTRYRVLECHGELALVEAIASPATRHQIRVHVASLGAPLLGDRLYGGDATQLKRRHALHASRLAYAGGPHVAAFAIESPLPAELCALLAAAKT